VGYDIFNAIAHIAMLILVGEVFILLVVPVLGIGLAGVIGLRIARRRLAGPVGQARELPRRGFMLVDRACNAAAWPIIQATSLWRGAKAALAALVGSRP